MFFVKSPMQMRREAEEREKGKRKPKPVVLPKPGPAERAKRPIIDCANFAAWLRTGMVEGR